METFHLGLTMAGAVSAGCYTGGVMDYIFEALDKWEKAKNGTLEGVDADLVPKHSVVLEAMGGTSAGGMTTTMAAIYALNQHIKPVTNPEIDPEIKEKDNIFYDSWVNLLDKTDGKTIHRALKLSDLKENKVYSILNSEFIDIIADNLLSQSGNLQQKVAQLPSYISKDLEVIISHAMNRGVPLSVGFKNNTYSIRDKPDHVTFDHFLFSHFKLNNGMEVNPDEYLQLNPYNNPHQEFLKKATIATGAFPVGLKFREFDNAQFPAGYIKNVMKRHITRKYGETSPTIPGDISWDESLLNNYHTTSVDGGAINNEPYGEVLELVKSRSGNNVLNNSGEFQKAGVVMIDPFPDSSLNRKKQYSKPEDLFSVAPRIIKTLWNQAKVKRNEMLLNGSDSEFRGVIFPVKYDHANQRKYDFPIASATLGAFGGFLSREFRHHDFFLGRDNARDFLRLHLSLPYDPDNMHPIHKSWTQSQRDRFLIQYNGKKFLPIIPDMNMLINDEKSADRRHQYTIDEMPKLKKSEILELKPRIKKRLKKILNILSNQTITKRKKSILGKLGGVFVSIYVLPAFFKILNEATNGVMDTIVHDVKCKGFLKGHSAGDEDCLDD